MSYLSRNSFVLYGLPLALAGILYLTGLPTTAISYLQRGMLTTGLFRPDTNLDGTLEVTPSSAQDSSVLDFHMVDPAGRSVDPQGLTGKVVFLNLWASWCPPCLAEMPNIDALYKDYAADDRIAFVLLNVEEDFTKGIEHVKQYNYSFPIYQLIEDLPKELQTGGLPTTFVIDPLGNVAIEHAGMGDYDTREFRNLLEELARGVE